MLGLAYGIETDDWYRLAYTGVPERTDSSSQYSFLRKFLHIISLPFNVHT